MLGDCSIGIVNSQTMIFDLISNFFGETHEKITPLSLIASSNRKKIFGLYTKDSEKSICFMRAGGVIIRMQETELVPKGMREHNP